MKTIIGVLAGVFVGAVIVEVVNRKKPGLISAIEDKASRTVGTVVGAFKEGYGQRPETKQSET